MRGRDGTRQDVLESLEGDPAGGALGDGHEGDDAELRREAAERAGDPGEQQGGPGLAGGGGPADGEGVYGELEQERDGDAEALGEDEHDEGGAEAGAHLGVWRGGRGYDFRWLSRRVRAPAGPSIRCFVARQ